jgi:hypothetical protein
MSASGQLTPARVVAGSARGVLGWQLTSNPVKGAVTLTTAQLVFSEDELLQDHDGLVPLFAGGVRCHGGFDGDGNYVSPRTLNRWPAIHAWEAQRQAQFGTDLMDVPLETWPASFPNVEQSKLLLRNGVSAPTIAALTRIGTIEGFGVMLRHLPVPEFRHSFDEEIDGTAIAHIGGGLFEAHARDEAGFDDRAGHDKMWFAARDIAFEHPVTEDETTRMLARMGIGGAPRSADELAALRRAVEASRVLPADIDYTLEMVVTRMIGLLLIEISAFHGFAWAAAVLSDEQLVAGEGEAARLVGYIRSDESPHVAWLRTALSEMRDRTWVGESGRRHAGSELVGLLWDRALRDSLHGRRQENLNTLMREIDFATEHLPGGRDLVQEMLSLGSVVRLDDGTVRDSTVENLIG